MSFQASIRLEECREAGARDVPGKQWAGALLARGNVSVSAGEDGTLGCRIAAVDARTCLGGLIKRDAAHGGSGLFLDLGFALGAATPGGEGETRLDGLFEIIVGLGVVRVGFAEG